MIKGLIGKKLGMTRLFLDNGREVPVTMLEAGPCTVVQIKTLEKDAYQAVQLGFGQRRVKLVNKPEAGHFRKADVQAAKILKEFKVDDVNGITAGQMVDAAIFTVGEKINVTGKSKGRGFTGVIKRHGFGGGRASHGCTTHNSPGSIGNSATPSKTHRGRRMAGHCGDVQTQARNLRVVDVRPENNLILVRGAVPGATGSIVILEKS
ncbi:MAG: 50S ribosomal protein L3 [Desulfarculales bacterium]|jgi:large subunit ribosomal protein L3|nr:50S ribosomal protein L3 [Desulfarculales bacterium]